jgi:hypothetical protein
MTLAQIQAFINQLVSYWAAIQSLFALFGAKTPAAIKAAADDLAAAHAATNTAHAALQATLSQQ